MELSTTLVRLRKKKGISQKELAKELKITRQAVSRWETGRAAPAMETLLQLCNLYEVTLDELYRGDCAGEERPAEQAGEEPAEEPEAVPEEEPEAVPEEEPEEEAEGETEEAAGEAIAAISHIAPEEMEVRPKKIKRRRWVVAAVISVYVSVYLWGVLTNSQFAAIDNLVFLTVILLAVGALYGVLSIVTYVKKGQKK